MPRTSAAAMKRIDAAKFAAASTKVQRIVAEDVAPLLARGMKRTQIAERLNIDVLLCDRYILLAQNMWKTSATDLISEWRGRVFTTYAEVTRALWEAFEESKANNIVTTVTEGPEGRVTTTKTAPPDIRWLSALVQVNKEIATICGLRSEAPVISVQEVDPNVRHSLAPMSPDSYMSLLAANGGQLSVTVPPPVMPSAAVTVEATDATVG
jgi:hypothetical protein